MIGRHRTRLALCAALAISSSTTVAVARQLAGAHPSRALSITARGEYLFAGESVKRADLPQRILEAISESPESDRFLALDVDEDATYSAVTLVLLVMRERGYDHVRFTVSGGAPLVDAYILQAPPGVKGESSGLPMPERAEHSQSGPPPAPPPSRPPPPPSQPRPSPPPLIPGSVGEGDLVVVLNAENARDKTVEVNGKVIDRGELVLLLSPILRSRPDDARYVALKAPTGIAFGEVAAAFGEIEMSGGTMVLMILDDFETPRTFVAQSLPPADDSLVSNVRRVPGGVLARSAIRKPQPAYPAMAKAAGIEGAVVVEVVVGEDGTVVAAKAVSGHPLLRDAAVAAARQWTFERKLLIDGTRTKIRGKVIGTITLNFRLPRDVGPSAPS